MCSRARNGSSSSGTSSPLTPPRPLHPPSGFSDSRELSEAECDRELLKAEGRGAGEGVKARGRRKIDAPGGSDGLGAELTHLLQRYQVQNAHGTSQKSPYSINV